MNNKDFIHQLSLRLDISQEDVQSIMNKTIDIMGDIFQEGDSIQMTNFGTFEVKKRIISIYILIITIHNQFTTTKIKIIIN